MAKEAKSKEKKSKASKEKKNFLKDTKAELKKVIWPTPKQLINNTSAVIVIVLIVGIIVFALDFCFTKVNEFGVDKLKSVVQTSENVIEDTNTDSSGIELVNDDETGEEDTETSEGDSKTDDDSENSKDAE